MKIEDVLKKPNPMQPPEDLPPIPKPEKQQRLDNTNAIPKKVAAIEIIRVLKQVKTLAMISATTPLIIVALAVYGTYIAGVGALAVIGIAGWYLFKSQNEIKYLQNQYGV